jgi:hypothetical protein
MTNQPINDGGPAFPHTTQWDGITPAINYHGISMRDYFAAAALQGICSSRSHSDLKGHAMASAKVSYDLADAMLKAREAK